MRPELQDIVDEVSRLLGRPAILEDRHFNLVAFCSHGGEIDEVRQHSILQRGSTAAVREWFEGAFWPLYPRHEGRSKALEAANVKATTPEKRAFYLARLNAQLGEYSRRKQESGQRVIPMGATWFNQDRADDEFDLAPESSDRNSRKAEQNAYPDYVSLSSRAS